MKTHHQFMVDIQVGERAARVLSDPFVQTFFSNAEADLVDAIVNAPLTSEGDEKRMGLACQIAALRSLQNTLTQAVADKASAERIVSAGPAPD